MSAPKPLSKVTLPEDVVKQDRKKCSRYDQCGLGQKAIYMGSSMSPRKFYIPYEAVTHVFKRVAVSKATGKGFLAPILYIVVRYDDGKEQQCSFRYLTDADKMMDQLSREHPEISLLSPEGEKKAAAKAAREEAIEHAELTEAKEHEIRMLNNAKLDLEKRPSLYEKLVVTARLKRTQDLINPHYQQLAVAVFAGGAVLLVVGGLMMRHGGFGSVPILLMLVGAAAMFMMVNSKALPTRKHNRKHLTADYEAAVAAMEKNLDGLQRARAQEGYGDTPFPLPACYCHPVVIERMIRIIREGRAETGEEALAVLKADLKAADSSVALSGKEYDDVVLIKPLFTVAGYR